MIERFAVNDRAQWLERRKADVTASVAACLFGDEVHPHMSAYKLWAIKSRIIAEDDRDSKAKRRGRILEPVALDVLREDFPKWKIAAGRAYYRDPVTRLGATPDALAFRPDIEGQGIIQVKSAGEWAFLKNWKRGDAIEVPLWIAVQALVEAELTGSTWAAVAVLDADIEIHVEDVRLKPALMIELRRLVAEFWRRVETRDPYPPDYRRDAATIAGIYADDDGSETDLGADARVLELLAQRKHVKEVEACGAAARKEREAIDAEIIHRLGNAERGRLADGTVISAKTTRRKGFVVQPSSYRTVRIKP